MCYEDIADSQFAVQPQDSVLLPRHMIAYSLWDHTFDQIEP